MLRSFLGGFIAGSYSGIQVKDVYLGSPEFSVCLSRCPCQEPIGEGLSLTAVAFSPESSSLHIPQVQLMAVPTLEFFLKVKIIKPQQDLVALIPPLQLTAKFFLLTSDIE